MKKYIIALGITANCFTLQSQTFTLIKDINPGTQGSSINELTVYNNKIIFSAEDVTSANNEPWVSDGVSTGTSILKDIVSPFNSYPREFIEAGGKLYFTTNATGGLWVTDGTLNGTMVASTNINYNTFVIGITKLNGEVFFGMSDSLGDYELWKSNGTTLTVSRVKDINPTGSSTDEIITVSGKPRTITMNNKLYFVANDGIHGYEIWVTDGTAGGTNMVADINNTGQVNIGHDFTVLNNHLYFTANTDELWVLDGTNNNITKLVSSGAPGLLPPLNNKVYFVKDGSSLWETNGTLNGTSLFLNNHAFYHCIEYNGQLICGNSGNLWKTDGTVLGSTNIGTINPNQFASANISYFTKLGNDLYFIAEDGVNQALWSTDGINVTKLQNPLAVNMHPFSSNTFTNIIAFNNSLYFNANYDNNGSELWSYTPSITSITEDVTSNISVFPNPGKNNIILNSTEIFKSIAIMDLTGKELIINAKNNVLDISDLYSGVYIIRAYNDKGIYVSKFVKE